MRYFLLFLTLLVGLFSSAQGDQTIINIPISPRSGVSFVQTILGLPTDYAVATSTNYPILINLHGRGESRINGSNVTVGPSAIYNSGGAGATAYWRAQGTWPNTFTDPRTGGAFQFITISPQAPGKDDAILSTEINGIIEYMYANYRCDTNRLYIMGISGGGGALVEWAGRYSGSRRHKPAAIFPASAQIGSPSQAMINAVVADSIAVYGIGDAQGGDGLGTQTRVFSTGNFGGNGGTVAYPGGYTKNQFQSYSGGHCCWNTYWNPTNRQTIAKYYGGGSVSMNEYEYALQFTQGASGGSGGNAPPTANAGSDGSITLPTTAIALTGSGADVDGTIASYAWTQTVGTTATISSPTAASTNITGLTTAGVRIFRLTVTDNLGATATDDVQVTVSPAAGGGSTTQVINVNLYGSALYSNSEWNNWLVTSSLTKTGLLYSEGSASTVTAVLSFQGGYADNTASYPVTAFPQVVGRDASYAQSTTRTLTLSGLNNAKQYDIALLATRGKAGEFTRFAVGALADTISTNSNFTDLAVFNNLSPVSGQLVVELSAVNGGTFNYLNGFTLTERTTGTGNASPAANAGNSQTITSPTSSVTLTGGGTDADGSIVAYAWTQVSGTAATITSPAAATTGVSGMTTAGVRVFRLTVTDNGGATGTSDVSITVNASNQAPLANGGGNKTITLPVNSVLLTGSGTDADGTITSYSWSQVSGTAATIATPASASTNITGLTTAGTRVFRLSVTDNGGATATNDINVTVNAAVVPGAIDTIIGVAVGEYQTFYWTKSGRVYSTHWGGYLGVNRDTTALHTITGVIDGAGSQYRSIALKNDGGVALIFKDNANSGREGVQVIDVDYLGNPFTGNNKVYGFFESFITLRNGVPWIFGNKDYLNLTGGVEDATAYYAPRPLPVPSGKTVTKIQVMEATKNAGGQGSVLALLNDGTLITYTRRGGGAYTVVPGLSGIVEIGAISQFAYVAASTTNVWGWGAYSEMLGLPANTATPTSILSSLTAVGLQMPLKSINSNWTCVWFLDSKNDLYGLGDNAHGNIGNGQQWPDWRRNHYFDNGTATFKRAPYAWDFRRNQYPQFTPVQIYGKFSKVFSSGILANQAYAMDMNGELYSWGRNKAYALGNKQKVPNDDQVPEWGNIVSPTRVTPLDPNPWPQGGGTTFDTASTRTPQAAAGLWRYNQPSYTLLWGKAHQQAGGTITARSWTKVSGPSGGNILNPTSDSTTVNGMVNGTYVFRYSVTSSNGLTATSDIQVTSSNVTPPNVAPVSQAGADQAITLPTATVTLNGNGSDADGTVASHTWSKVSGPGPGTITSPSAYSTTVTGLAAGVYAFKLAVVDNSGTAANDTMLVTVNPANQPPVVNAGPDREITLPVSILAMAGSATDADGDELTYTWSQVSGAGTYVIDNPAQPYTAIYNLTTGVYVFRLTVTDGNGNTATDDVQVTVKAQVVNGAQKLNRVFINKVIKL